SSRRRHTSSKRDWSSDVCSSDLPWLRYIAQTAVAQGHTAHARPRLLVPLHSADPAQRPWDTHCLGHSPTPALRPDRRPPTDDSLVAPPRYPGHQWRSEERRVGKEE